MKVGNICCDPSTRLLQVNVENKAHLQSRVLYSSNANVIKLNG